MSVLRMAAGATGNQTLYQIISGLGLTSGLKVCLDAGDSASYNPGVQTDKWLDTSGNGYDWYRGTGTGGDARDPTFNGSAGGLTSSEYWSFDGGDYFTYDTTIETWMQNLSRNNAQWAALVVMWPIAGTTAQSILNTKNSMGTNNGMALQISSAEAFTASVANGTTSSDLFTSATLSVGGWHVYGVSVDEPSGASGGRYQIDGSETTFNATYATPSTTSEVALGIGARTTANTLFFNNNTRLACLAIWEGAALSSANLTALYNGIKGRFGL